MHTFQAFIEMGRAWSRWREAYCPSLPRPSAAWVTASVTVWVTFSVTSFTTLSPDSWALFKASAMAVRKTKEELGV